MKLGIIVTDIARDELNNVLKGSEFKTPALRIVYSGAG